MKTCIKKNVLKPATVCFKCNKNCHKTKDYLQNRRWYEVCELKTHNIKFCRKRDNVNKVKENTSFYYKVRVNPNIKPVNFELIVDCEVPTYIVNDEHRFIKFEEIQMSILLN